MTDLTLPKAVQATAPAEPIPPAGQAEADAAPAPSARREAVPAITPAEVGRTPRPDSRCPTEVKAEIVLRLLRGETLTELAAETHRPRKQLASWRQRFVAGGEAALDGRADPAELERLRIVEQELSERVSQLEQQNRQLSRRLDLVDRSRINRSQPHPFCSQAYAKALEEPGVQVVPVPQWRTFVLVRQTPTGLRQATGLRPIASLDPDCDIRGGLDHLRREGIASVSLVTDPLWCPDLAVLQQEFTSCRPFKQSYFIDRETERVHLRKRHRNMVNRARRAVEIRSVALADHLEEWLRLYQHNVQTRQIAQPFSPAYFDRLLEVAGLETLAVLVDGQIVTMTLWVRYGDIRYYHDGASSEAGFETSASYAAFGHVIETATDVRYLVLGGSAHFRDEPQDGLAVFKRGFANASATSYLCSAVLNRPRSA